MKNSFVLLIATLLCVGTTGCFKKAPEPPAAPVVAPEPQFIQHKVAKNGETLSSIAATYTGKGANWTKIRDANPQLKPNKLPIGAVVNIPTALLAKKGTAKPGDQFGTKNPAAKPFTADTSNKTVKAGDKPKTPVKTTTTSLPPVEKKTKPPEDLIQVKPSQEVEPSMPKIEEEVAVKPSTTTKPVGVGVVQEPVETNDQPAASPTTTVTTMPSNERIDPAPDREREKLLDELLSK